MTQKSSLKIGPISGFPEYLPAQQRAFDEIVRKIRGVYESFGYTPLETAAVERIDTLTSKGIDSKEVYGLRRLAGGGLEEGSKASADELALRFDLTVPTARYVAQNYGQLVFPFRRHQIQPVWRGERPQAGRYRQFHQCDIDYIADGAGNLPLAADAEILACAYTALKSLGLEFTMRVNNRQILEGSLTFYGLRNGEQRAAAIKVIDDLEKIGTEGVCKKLTEIGFDSDPEEYVLSLKNPEKLFRRIDGSMGSGRKDLNEVFLKLEDMLGSGIVGSSIIFDPTIARGLDYYTGTVMETRLHAAPELGSICSGGRYENLAESLSERALPGVGISIGLSRLATWLMTQPRWAGMSATSAQVYVAFGLGEVSGQLRSSGINVEEGLEEKPLGKQLMTAEKRGHIWAVIGLDGVKLNLRHLPTRKDTILSKDEVVRQIIKLASLRGGA